MIPPVYFASGSNRPADIRGFAAVGHPVGVAAPELSENAVRELEALAGRGVPVFVDSGAFSEVEFGPEGPRVVRPISDARWAETLALYERLARALGPLLSVVAPDRVGDQARTLYLLGKYKRDLARIAALGARVLVPIQKGARSQAEFARVAALVLRGIDFVHAVPSKKSATTLEELEAFAREVRPRRVHLLGLGVRNASASAALEVLERCSPGVEVSLDSNAIAAAVGRAGGKVRRLSAARDRAAEIIAAAGGRIRATVQELGIVLAFGSPEQVDRRLAELAA